MTIDGHDGDGRSGGKGIPRGMIFAVLTGISLLVSAPSASTNRHSFSSSTFSANGSCLTCHLEGGGLKGESVKGVSTPLTYTSSDGRSHDLDDVSKLCMTCHDGTTAEDAGGFSMGEAGTSLKDDHPVGIAYPPRAANGTLRKNYRKLDNRIKLFGPSKDQVSCATCHDPHENGRRAMLREPVGNRDFCLQCHAL